MDKSWEDWWQELLSLAPNAKIQSVMIKCKRIYREYYDNELSAEEAYFEEWG